LSPDARTYRKCPECDCGDYTRKITKTSFTHKTEGYPPSRGKPETTEVLYICEWCGFRETWDKYKELKEKEKTELDERMNEIRNEIRGTKKLDDMVQAKMKESMEDSQ
jgi:hypothetical protein